MKQILSKYIAPLLWKYGKRSSRFEIFQYLEQQQWESLKRNEELQSEKLYALLSYAVKYIPYYRRVAAERKILLSKETVFEDINRFPILTKEIIRTEFNNLYNPVKKKTAILNHTGGTTGQPLEFLQDQRYRDYAAANKMLFSSWCGLKNGGLTILLWGSEKDVLERRKGVNDWLFRVFMNSSILNSFNMSQEKMLEYCRVINENHPDLIIAYVQAISELAKFAKQKGIHFAHPVNVMTAAGTLYQYQRDILEEVFQGKAFNSYGSREMSDIACECEQHEGMHLNILTHFIEILNDDLKNVTMEGQEGEVYVTTLENYTMPLIRYKIGDQALHTNSECSCGRGFPLIKNVIGRVAEGLKNGAQKFIPAEFFIHFIGVVFNKGYIDQFQVIQDTVEKITIRVVLNNQEEFEQYKKDIEKSIRKVFETPLEIVWKIEKKIECSSSGKFLYVISHVV